MVTSLVDYRPEVTSIVVLTTLCPFVITESGANGSDECAIREGIKSACVCAEHQAVETILVAFGGEEFLFESVHPVPFAEYANDTLVFSVVNPVLLVLLFLYTAQTNAVNGVFGLQTNHVVGEEIIFFEGAELIPVCIRHRVDVEEAIGFTTFHMNANLGLVCMLQFYVVDDVVDVEVCGLVGINDIDTFMQFGETTRSALALHEFCIEFALVGSVFVHEEQHKFLFRDGDTRRIGEL